MDFIYFNTASVKEPPVNANNVTNKGTFRINGHYNSSWYIVATLLHNMLNNIKCIDTEHIVLT